MWQRVKNVYHFFVAVLANLWFGFPAKKIIVIGVTGTDGKTTTVSLIYHILNQTGYNTSMISSVGAKIGGKEYNLPFHVTTPSPFALQGFLRRAVNAGSKYMVLEVTSHALDQNRVFGINFEIGVLTNVTHEHLDYHKTYLDYVLAKAKLLAKSKKAIVNKDDRSYKTISLKFKVQSSKFLTYGMGNDTDVNPKVFPFKTDLIGKFNIYNILAAVAVCRSLDVPDSSIRAAIESFEAPIGREEIVYQNSFTVMIDFAHTPNALEQLLSSLAPEYKGKLIHVFGSAGERDHKKRPLMGAVSSKFSDIIILTAEDPRSEPVQEIITEIESGIKNHKSQISNHKQIQIFKIPNRQEAINTAIKMAKKGDLVLITGKGHEKSMNYGYGEEPWDEFKAVKIAFRPE